MSSTGERGSFSLQLYLFCRHHKLQLSRWPMRRNTYRGKWQKLISRIKHRWSRTPRHPKLELQFLCNGSLQSKDVVGGRYKQSLNQIFVCRPHSNHHTFVWERQVSSILTFAIIGGETDNFHSFFTKSPCEPKAVDPPQKLLRSHTCRLIRTRYLFLVHTHSSTQVLKCTRLFRPFFYYYFYSF